MIALFVAAFAVQAAPEIPAVALFTPPAPVGYAHIDLETDQDDALTPQSGDTRRLSLEIWYPAAQAGTPRPWASTEMGAALSGQFPFPDGFEASVSAHAAADASIADGTFPVILFSPGLSFPVALYQSFTENLAAHGYIVVAVNHPHALAHIDYADGTVRDMSHWPRISDEAERQRFLAEHAGVWQADLVEVLDEIDDWDTPRAGNPVAGHIDLSRIGIAGHSYGGTAAGRLSRDPRIGAAVAMEGAVRDPADENSRGHLRVGAPFLHIIGGYNRLEMEIDDYRPSPDAPVYRVVIDGTGHAQLSDLIYLYAHYADEAWHARHRYDLAPDRVLRIAQDHIVAFFDFWLKGEDETPLLHPRGLAERLEGPRTGGFPEAILTIDTAPPERG